MMPTSALAKILLALLISSTLFGSQQQFPITSVVDASSIAGRDVELDAHGKLLPWPMPHSTGYSYSSYFLTQWTILWDQYNRQRLPYYYCCFDFDRTTFEMSPDTHWANSTGYLRAMMQGFVERLYPYTGDPHTLEFLQTLSTTNSNTASPLKATHGLAFLIHRRTPALSITQAGASTERTSSSRTSSEKTATPIFASTR